jgi:Type ISP C-terminal specificity domain/N-6 DNA Methylase
MPEPDIVSPYLRALARLREQVEATPELSLREPFLRLVRDLARQAGRTGLLIAPEANAGQVGQPDVFVKDGPRLVGFCETKPPEAPLERMLRTDRQLRRYRQSLPNWVLTDYYRFLFLRDGDLVQTCDVRDDSTGLALAFAGFFAYVPPTIRSPNRLALELGRRARIIRDGLAGLVAAEGPDGPLRQVHQFYRRTLMNDLDEAGFADTFAQTIVYGMFLGWLRSNSGNFDRSAATSGIPASVPFLRSAVRLLTDEDLLPDVITRLLDDLVALLANTQVEPIRAEVAAGGLERDLVIYFYEQFLERYDKGERRNRGVYYTPPELVGYLLRSTEALLRRHFSLDRGLADPAVRLLDPATGTGTFLLGAGESALRTEAPRGTAAQRQLIHQHLLQHFYGFELLAAPYAIAHLKLTSFFSQEGYELAGDDRVPVYLTNTLAQQDGGGDQLVFLPMLRGIVEEAEAAARVKRDVPVLVIVGNPPYERTSHNANPHSDRLLADFYTIDGVRLPDRNTGPLRDDYLRFVRWSVWKLLEQHGAPGHGILAFVTNRAFTERVLHRGVRRFLLDRFDEIWVFDLHGDQREWFRDRVDEKVFRDVQAGIALTLFVKRPQPSDGALAIVRYRDMFGTRAEKLRACKDASLDDEDWRTLQPRHPLWLFVPYDVPAAYDSWPDVTQLFPLNVVGVQTHRDQLVVAFDETELRERLRRFGDPAVPDSHWTDQHVRSNRDWDLRQARTAVRTEGPRHIMQWNFRGLDRRYVAFDERLIDYTRTEVSPHLLGRSDNLALVFANGSLPDGPYALVTRAPVPAAALSWRTLGQAYFAPLWLHESLAGRWTPNVPAGLLQRLADADLNVTPEKLLHYVYAVLNSPSFRQRFAAGLRYNFARVPLARQPEVFDALAQLGAELSALHMLEHPGLEAAAPRMDGNDSAVLERPNYEERTQTLHLSANLVARPVSRAAWTYQQGAYPVVREYVDARIGRPLHAEEFDELRRIIAAVSLTGDRLPVVDDLVTRAADAAFTAADLGFRSDVGELN